ncbi:MAG: FecR domain-containing protein [Spirochaetia bacterium]
MKRIIGLSSFLLAVAALCFAQAGQPGPRVPTITYMEGTVTVDGRPAAIGDTVPLGSVVVTSAQSLADIEFNVRNVMRLSENTTLVFNPRNLQTGSELRVGALTLVLKALPSGAFGESFLVRTPTVVAGVRGTSFFVKVESPSSTYVCACNGVVQVLGADGRPLKELAASHHKGVRVAGSADNPQVADAPMLYHTDEDVEKVAADIGYTIDWNVVDR